MQKIFTLKSLLLATLFSVFVLRAGAQGITENFDDITLLAGNGWVMTNASVAVGSTNWFQGTSIAGGGPFDAFNGATNAYISGNFNNTASTGTISNWLMMPNRTLRNGDVITFYTRKATPDTYADRLEVRLSTNGASTSVGSGATVGDYTTLLLSVNPTLVLGVYPTTWTQYTIIISGLPVPLSGRVAFRYFVTSGGQMGVNSDYIGIDNVVYTPYVCPVINLIPSLIDGGIAGTSYSTSLIQTGGLGAASFSLTAGALPPGLTLSAAGTISGTPTATGTFNFTATVSDASGCTGSRAYSITIICPANGAVLSSMPSLCTNGTAYTFTEGSPVGGIYSGTGVNADAFDPSNGTQLITYTLVDVYGCTQVATNTISVNSPPTVGAASDALANTLCAGTFVSLTGSGADTYEWDNSITDGEAFAPANTTTYTVTGTTTATACSNTAMITVTVNPLPEVIASSNAVANTVCEGSLVSLNGGGADTYEWDNSIADGEAFAPTNTTTYTVTGTTTATACSNTAMITVTVNPLPQVTASSNALANTVCEGSFVTLNGGGADTYQWENSITDGEAFAPTNTTLYTVTGTLTTTACSNTAMITVTVNPLPQVTASSSALANTVCEGSLVSLNGGGADTYQWDNSITDGEAFAPANTTTYTVTGSITATACSNTAMITLMVNPLPDVTASSSALANTVCKGSLVSLNGGGADTYEWDNNIVDGVAFTATTTMDYSVTGTSSATGCISNNIITLTVNPLPEVELPAFVNALCITSGTVTLIDGSPAGGEYSGTGVTGNTFDASAAGEGIHFITYSYSDANGCMSSDTSGITVDLCTGIAANDGVSFSVYPNPNNGVFTLGFTQVVTGKVTVRITDFQGKLISTDEVTDFAGVYKNTFDLSHLPKGMYLLEVTCNNIHHIKKVVLK